MSAPTQVSKPSNQAPEHVNSMLPEFLNLKTQFAGIREEVTDAVTRVMESQKFILGDEVRLFEEEIAAKFGARHAIACGSGSDALVLAFMAAGIGAGDEVITSPFTYVATADSIARVGARPVFVDIDPKTFNLDPERVPSAVNSRTKAVVPVHLFGMPAELGPIASLAQSHGLVVIEDAAQAIAAQYQGRSVGTIGTMGCFSFFPSKNLGGAGDGGLVATNDFALAERLRLLRVHGSRQKYRHEILGVNSRLDALQAAILRVKLRYLDQWTTQRHLVAQRYRELFGREGLEGFVELPSEPPSRSTHVYNQFTIRCHERDQLCEFLKTNGVPTEIYYPVPLHLQPVFSYLGCQPGEYPEAERASTFVLSLPIYPELELQQQEFVVRAIAQFYFRHN